MTLTMTDQLFKATDQEDRPKRIRQAVWVDADLGFWVGNMDGAYVGSIEQLGRHYCAHDTFGTERGAFATLAEAQTCLESFIAHPSVQARIAGNVD